MLTFVWQGVHQAGSALPDHLLANKTFACISWAAVRVPLWSRTGSMLAAEVMR